MDIFLGIDFGHGETAAAICKNGRASAVNILQNNHCIPSVMAVSELGVLIGTRAVYSKPDNVFYMGWKKRPSQMTESERALTVRYMKEVYDNILSCNGECLTRENHVCCIATPSGWWSDPDQQDVQCYKRMAEEAGMIRVEIHPESRAAMILGRKENNHFISITDIKCGIMVLDIGSSTMDFTYFQNIEKPKEAGENLGASLIDKMILMQALECSDAPERITEILKANPAECRRLEFKARDAKEAYFNLGGSDLYASIEDGSRDELELDVSLEPDFMTRIVGNPGLGDRDPGRRIGLSTSLVPGELSWRGHFRKIMEAVKARWNLRDGEFKILKTGGASRMFFVNEDIQAVFGKNVSILADPEPSTIVARGLAYLGNADQNSRSAVEELRKVAETFEKEAVPEIIKEVLCDFADKQIEPAWEIMQQGLEMQKNSGAESEATADALQKFFTEHFIAYENENLEKNKHEATELLMEKTLHHLEKGLVPKIRSLISLYGASNGKEEQINVSWDDFLHFSPEELSANLFPQNGSSSSAVDDGGWELFGAAALAITAVATAQWYLAAGSLLLFQRYRNKQNTASIIEQRNRQIEFQRKFGEALRSRLLEDSQFIAQCTQNLQECLDRYLQEQITQIRILF